MRLNITTGIYCILLFALTARLPIPPPVHAQSEDFEEHYRRGTEFAKAGKYAEAIRAYESAYRLNKLTTLTLNIGLLHLRLKHGEQAQRFCSQYLREEASPSEATRNKATDCLIKSAAMAAGRKPQAAKPLQPPFAGQPPRPAPVAAPLAAPSAAPQPLSVPASSAMPAAQPPPAPPQAQTETKTGPTAPPSTAATDQVQPAVPQTPPAQPAPSLTAPHAQPKPAMALAPQPAASPEHRPVYKKWWFWTVVGVVAAGAATGIAVGVVGSRAPEDLLGSVSPASRRMLEF